MKVLTKEQDKKMLELLLEDSPFTQIRKELGLGQRFEIKQYCEYHGGKLEKAYKLHVNNYKKNTSDLPIPQDSLINLTKEDFYKALYALSQQNESLDNTKSITNKNESNTNSITDENIVDIIALPKVLPMELTGENYKIKQTSIKVIEGPYEEFNEFCKGNHYSKVELLSLALLEFIEKYRSK